MKIVVIGGSGLIGSNVVRRLAQQGHEVIAASPSAGINTITREGLAEALIGTQVVIDVANSPSFEDKAVLDFFQTSGRHLLAAEAVAGVRHHLALSVVGTDRNPDIGYFRAKLAQEDLIKASGIPWTILRATQFFEFVGAIVQGGTEGDVVRTSTALIQPIAADDVAATLAELALGAPLNGTVDVGGPEKFRFIEMAQKYLAAKNDPRPVVGDAQAGYFGAPVNDTSLTTAGNARVGAVNFAQWLQNNAA